MNTYIVKTVNSSFSRLKPIPLEKVRLKNGFWKKYIDKLVNVTLPSQYDILEETGRIDNFRRAAGKISKEFSGFYFNDSDVYKWVEAASLALAYEKNEYLFKKLFNVVKEIIDAQDEDGYLDTYFVFDRKRDRWRDLQHKHELYCAGHLIQAAIAYRRALGKDDLFDTAVSFADHIYDTFGYGKKLGVPGHPEIEMALVELYRETSDTKYLELSKFFVESRGKGLIGGSENQLDHKPFLQLDEIVGHVVRALYLCCGATDIYMETGEQVFMETLLRLWHDAVYRKMYITGGMGSRYIGESFGERYELPNRRAYQETCASIANIMWNWRMLLALGDAKYADVMELAIYNGALAGISLSGKEYFYVNPLEDRGKHRRQKWFSCACCPTNIIRLIASIPGYLYSYSGNDIWIHHYVGSSAEIKTSNNLVKIDVETDYPFDGYVKIIIYSEKEDEFNICLRIPGWSERNKLVVNKKETIKIEDSGKYYCIKRSWSHSDVIELYLDMDIKFMMSHPYVMNNYRRAAIKRGPLVYCLEQTDNSYDVWNIAISPDEKFEIFYDPAVLDGIPIIKGKGYFIDDSLWRNNLYVSSRKMFKKYVETVIKAIPYYAWANREPGPMIVWIKII